MPIKTACARLPNASCERSISFLGFNAWVNILSNGRGEIQPNDFRTLIFGFLHSNEYRNRFGQP
jgi:hypothetical protein